MNVYIDTHEHSTTLGGAPRTRGHDTAYDVRLAATRSKPGRILASFATLAQAEAYRDACTDPRWGLVQKT
jgi:hypothetical protein